MSKRVGRPAREVTTRIDRELRHLMAKADIETFDVLADKCGMSPSTLYRYRTGSSRPSLASITALSRVLNVSSNEITYIFR